MTDTELTGPAMTDRAPSVESREPEREGGVVLVWFALLLFGLIAITALCVDIGLWYVEAVHVQKAADSAALAGAVHLPGNPANATAVAKDTAAKNSYTDGDTNGSVQVLATQVATQPNQLEVKVTKTFSGIFGAVFGIPNLRITRSATAQYETAVDMGSPASIFANEPIAPNDPASSGSATPPGSWSNVSGFSANMWGNIFGYQSPKGNGDARHAHVCATGNDQCIPPTNTEYSDAGYYYRIAVDASKRPAGAKLAIEVFDPGAVQVGDHCTAQNLSDPTVRTSANPWTTKNGTVATDANVRYDWGDTSNRAGVAGAGTFCSGDSHDAGANPPLTTYLVRANTTPFDPNAAPIVNQGTCAGLQIPGFDKTFAGGTLDQGSGSYDAAMASVFRQWVPVCMLDPSTAPAGDYLLQIRTNVLLGGSAGGPGSAPDTGGSNRFAVRAAWVTGGSSFTVGTYTAPPTYVGNGGLTIAGVGYMGLYANAAAGASAPNFYMARVLPGGSQTLRVRLFDIGDCGGCGGSPQLTFKKPDGSDWDSCKVRIGDTNAFTTYTPCSFPDTANGLWTTVDIAIPSSYACTISAATDCWTKMTYQLAGSGALNDTTTWSAQILGNPVRLVR
jgi:Flp pilus assembly protein TadG